MCKATASQISTKRTHYKITFKVPEGYMYTMIVEVQYGNIKVIPMTYGEWRGRLFTEFVKSLHQNGAGKLKINLIEPIEKSKNVKNAPGDMKDQKVLPKKLHADLGDEEEVINANS